MSDSREASPDWLREYQAPSQDFITIPSCSDSSPEVSPKRYDDTPYRLERSPKQEDSIYIDSAEGTPVKAKAVKTKDGSFAKAKNSKALRSDDTSVKEEEQTEELAEEDLTEKSAGPPVSSRLPLSFPDKVQRTKVFGARARFGSRVRADDVSASVLLEIEAIMNDFIQLEPQSNVFNAETMIEGTLEGYAFDSDEEGDKAPKSSTTQQNDQNNENGDQDNPKVKRKVDKSLGVTQKKAKTAAKPAKKAARKPLAVKR